MLEASTIAQSSGSTIGTATFNFDGGTLQAGPGATTMNINIPITLAAASMCELDMNGRKVNLTSLTTASGLTDFNFATPGLSTELLTVGSITVNPVTAISFGAAPVFNGNGYCDLIAGDANAATDVSNFQVKGNFYPVVYDPNTGDIAVAVPEPGTLALLALD